MDPLTALSVAGTIVQFVDFGGKLLSKARELYADSQLENHRQSRIAVDDLLDYTTKLQQPLRHTGVSEPPTEDEIALERVCKGCDELAKSFIARLDQLQVSKQNFLGKAKEVIVTTVVSVWTNEELDAIRKRLAEYRREIDSRVIYSLSRRLDLVALQQSERFDRLDASNKAIVAALVSNPASNNQYLQDQISTLATLLDRAAVVISTQEDTTRKIIADVFRELASDTEFREEGSIVKQVRAKERRIRAEILVEILDNLYFDALEHRFEAVQESHAKTFDWIFQHPEHTPQYAEGRRWDSFRLWLESGNGLYWINGKAGSGKSTLMKHIVSHHQVSDYLAQWAGNSKLYTLKFFFWNSGLTQQRSQTGLLRTLLHDTLRQTPELIPVVLPTHWAKRYSSKYLSRPPPIEIWNLSTLTAAFRTLVSQTILPLRLCLFIDGLDEYEGDDSEIAELFGNVSMSENVKVCCSSRPHQIFQDAFADRPGLRLQDLTFPDIRKYAFDKLESNARMQILKKQEPDATNALILEIVNAANGVFLWVRIVVHSLLSGLNQHDGISHLQMRLHELPDELDELYHHMIFKVDKVYEEERPKLFQIVGCAFRHQNDKTFGWGEPPRLTILLLSFALEPDPQSLLEATPKSLTGEQILARCQKMGIVLRTRTGGLLEVNYGHHSSSIAAISPNMTISYLHRTVRDYLELPKTLQELSNRTSGQRQIAFSPNQAIFQAHIWMLKYLEFMSLHQGVYLSSWVLIGDAITWANWAEPDNQADQPIYLDEYYCRFTSIQ